MILTYYNRHRNIWRLDKLTEKLTKTEAVGRLVELAQERISNGFRLFGKYFENLWD
jgi:hypothetical protein